MNHNRIQSARHRILGTSSVSLQSCILHVKKGDAHPLKKTTNFNGITGYQETSGRGRADRNTKKTHGAVRGT